VSCADVDAQVPTRDAGLRDPRLWSNLRGALAWESAAERVAAHAVLDCREQTAADAAWEGLSRHGSEPVAPLAFAAVWALVLVLCAWRVGREAKARR
jgi:hypothetical protein